MIQLFDGGQENSIIRFTPRAEHRTMPTLNLSLISGYVCETCHNVYRAHFYTDTEVPLWAYEATGIISLAQKTYGEIDRIVPNEEEDGLLKTEFFQTANGNSQRITLKNHIIYWPGTAKSDPKEFFEPGPRPCRYTAVVPMQQNTLLRELWPPLAGNRRVDNLVLDRMIKDSEPNLAFTDHWLKTQPGFITQGCRLGSVVANGPIPMLVPREAVREGHASRVLSSLYDAWDTKLAEDEARHVAEQEINVEDARVV